MEAAAASSRRANCQGNDWRVFLLMLLVFVAVVSVVAPLSLLLLLLLFSCSLCLKNSGLIPSDSSCSVLSLQQLILYPPNPRSLAFEQYLDVYVVFIYVVFFVVLISWVAFFLLCSRTRYVST